MKNVTVTIYRDSRKEWRWEMRAANGRTIGASTEGYKRSFPCIKNLETVSARFVSTEVKLAVRKVVPIVLAQRFRGGCWEAV